MSHRKKACFNFGRGKCNRGAQCTYSHDPTQPCPFFQKPEGCFRAERCPFSHGNQHTPIDTRSSTRRSIPKPHDEPIDTRSLTRRSIPKPQDEFDIEASCRRWMHLMPRPNTNQRLHFQSVDTRQFFEIGWDLMTRGDVGTRQFIITKLGEESGLEMIKLLADLIATNELESMVSAIFRKRTLPFYRIISHPDVLSSLILEAPLDRIYTFLFGSNGRRALPVFQSTAQVIAELVSGLVAPDEDLFIDAITSSLAVLQRLIDVNQTAQVMDEFVSIVGAISASIQGEDTLPSARQSLVRIRRRLNIGASFPLASSQPTILAAHQSHFQLSEDLPGNLSVHGARHGNDSEKISEIQILPTAQEIMSERFEYLPSNDPTSHHLPGLPGLLDRQFRLLREDTVGQLRDAVHIELTRLERPSGNGPVVGKVLQTMRNIVYKNVRLIGLDIDRRRGLQIIAAFDQPESLQKKSAKQREEYWKNSKLLQLDALLCFVSASGRIIFFSVCDPIKAASKKQQAHPEDDVEIAVDVQPNPWRLPDATPSLSRGSHEATLVLSMVEHNPEDVAWVANHLGPNYRQRQSLVEFPGILLASFRSTLQALQSMSRTLDLPFADIIAPDIGASNAALLEPPAYTRKRGFRFDLSAITGGEPLELCPSQPFDYEKLRKTTILDEAQQRAVIQALSRGLALSQGPPGTGKSFSGVSIIKILLDNRKRASLGPIICVCFTNHALDQLLEHLLKDGVTQIIRLGSRSKSEALQNLTLHHVVKGITPTKTEKHDKWLHNRDIAGTIRNIEGVLLGLNNSATWRSLKDYLQKSHPHHHDELFRDDVDEEGFREVQGRRSNVMDNWLRRGSRNPTSNRPVPLLLTTSLKKMSVLERRAIHKYWIQQNIDRLNNELANDLDAFYTSKSALDRCHQEADLRCLLQAHVIGVTTTGLARNMDVLRRVRAKVMICEEAGEVLEAHVLTALLPGVEHAILIGDHEQLRPHINNYELQHDSPRGGKYSLDISLFERLVTPQFGNTKVPFSTLKTQRRMHPSIAELVRVPLYPELQDHSSVSEYPEVSGMRDRLFWLDHREKEDPRLHDSISQSKTNAYEVDLVAALVSHLVRQGIYGNEDIAVLTPYLGQLQKIKKRLASSFEIVVGARDQEDLEAQGLQENEPLTDGQIQPQKTTLLNAIRISTVDNFQGEEALVVIISLVRSNDEQKCGFLKTSNRINVLLSRARHGMYIIGNSDTASPVKMWSEVISILGKSGKIGQNLALCCPRHMDTPIEVSTPDDFVRLAPEGGCARRCSSRLLCGHVCPNMCHSTSLHNAVRCVERCQRGKKGCDHACPRVCGDRCEAQCQVPMFNILLPCGHIAQRLKCYEAQNPEKVQCKFKVEQTMPGCKHSVMVMCYELPLPMDYPCPATCGEALNCGHNCTRGCKECNTREEGQILARVHGWCRTPCGRPYTTCSHSCKSLCHGESNCRLCTERCEVSCVHSRCEKQCQEPCAPCAEDCSWSCPHQGRCPLPCAIPCDLLPCSKRCAKMLSCGHQCPSICGETCPDGRYCQLCAEPGIKETMVDFIMYSTFEDVDLDESPCIVPPCGHLLTLESMDGHMAMSDYYAKNDEGSIIGLENSNEPFSASERAKSCPTCRGPLRNINRYSRIVRRALLDESTKKFITWANTSFLPLTDRMKAIETDLRNNTDDGHGFSDLASIHTDSLEAAQLKGTRDEQVSQIKSLTWGNKSFKTIFQLRKEIKKFLEQVDETEQPFGRIYDLLQDARRHRGVEVEVKKNVDVLQVRNRLLTTVLLFRCDYAILLNFLNNCKKSAIRQTNGSRSIQINLDANRKDCEALIIESRTRIQPASEVEGQLYWARFLALERGLTESDARMTELLGKAREHLQAAQEVCDKYPGSTSGMMDEVDDVRKMLRDSVFYMPVSNEEKAAIYAAMAFSSTGHWYYCVNGHPFTVGGCGMPMVTSQCPQCGSRIGGHDHISVGGVTPATDLERQFRGMNVNV